jgi:hypothetical protein
VAVSFSRAAQPANRSSIEDAPAQTPSQRQRELPMKKTPPSAVEDARQRALTIRLLFVVGALAGLVACVLVSRML